MKITEEPEWPKTIDAAVEYLIEHLTEEDKQILRVSGNSIEFHMSLGMWIRNAFGLWKGNDELLDDCFRDDPRESKEYLEEKWSFLFKTEGKELTSEEAESLIKMLREQSRHPDSASGVILDALIERLRG